MIGCGDDDESSNDGDGAGGAAPAKSGMLTGSIRDEHGKPISVPVKYVVSINGIAEKSAEKVGFRPGVKPDGTYESKLPAGIYHPLSAEIEVKFNNNTYRRELDPVQDNTADRDSSAGIRQDWVWKISGPHFRYRDKADPKNHTNWYGGSVNVRLTGWRDDLNKPVTQPPAGTKYTFTFTPTSKLIDGSDAKEIKIERTFDGRDLDNNLLSDIPIAVYKLTGIETTPDGKTRKLVFGTAYAKYEPEAKIDFPATERLDPHLHILAFDRE
jgi:hypothetical protein